MSLIKSPGKFEGESHATLYAYSLMMNGDGDTYSTGDGGESYTVLEGPFDAASVEQYQNDPEYDGERLDGEDVLMIREAVGCIARECESGFVTCEWYDSRDKFNERVSTIENAFREADEEDAGRLYL